MKLILNLLTVPIKIVLIVPIIILALIAAIAGYEEASDTIIGALFNRWFK